MEFPEIVEQYLDSAILLQKLVTFNTTNPTGDESECIDFIADLLKAAEIDTNIYTENPDRPNLVARISGSGTSAPILLYGHVDVVTTEGQEWHYPPFEGKVAGDCIWGRGTLDMKGALAMMISSILKLKVENITPPGDIILAIVSDVEVGGEGAKYLVEQKSEIFKGVKYGIGEFGAFTTYVGDKKFYPIMVAEKQLCSIKITFKGTGGHGSIPMTNGATAKVGRFLAKINKKKLPVHITPVAENMVLSMAEQLSFIQKNLLKLMLKRNFTNIIIKLLGRDGAIFDAILHNTINTTLIAGGTKLNVVPEKVSVSLDGRILPGLSSEEFVEEIKNITGEDAEVSIIEYRKGPSEINRELFDTLANIIIEKDPNATPIELMLSGVTGASDFSKLGIQCYGFTPMLLPKGFNFTELIHGSDERIPITALKFGTEAIFELLNKF